MKTLIFLLAFTSYGQETIYRNLENTSLTRFKEDTTEYYSLYFQDETYQHIVSLKYIIFNDRTELENFIEYSLTTLEIKNPNDSDEAKMLRDKLILMATCKTIPLTKRKPK